jgi:hypothetical protein
MISRGTRKPFGRSILVGIFMMLKQPNHAN